MFFYAVASNCCIYNHEILQFPGEKIKSIRQPLVMIWTQRNLPHFVVELQQI